jgi:hypothetical protein
MHLLAVSYITALTDPSWGNYAATMPTDCRRSRCSCVSSVLRFLASVDLRLAAICHLFDWLVTGQIVPVNPDCISLISPVAVIDGRGLVVEDVKDHGESLGMGSIDKLAEPGDRPLGARSVPERQIKKLKSSNSERQIDHVTIDGAVRVAVERERAAWRRKLGRTMLVGLIGVGLFLVTTL